MKEFFGIFMACLLFIFLFVTFGGINVFADIWGIIIIAALFLSILITVYINQERKLEELEEKIRSLESEINPRE